MSDLKSKKAQKGGKTFFNIKIRADPAPEVKWQDMLSNMIRKNRIIIINSWLRMPTIVQHIFRFMNDVELVEDDHYKISVKEDEHLFRLDVLDITEDHCGKIKVVAKNENGEDSKEVSEAKIPRNNSTIYRAIQ